MGIRLTAHGRGRRPRRTAWSAGLVVLLVAATRVDAGDMPLEVTLKQVTPQTVVSNRFQVTIRNTNNADVVIVKPLNGSQWSWYLPFYSFHVTDANGKELRMATRHFVSGLYPGTKWPRDYMVVLKPGQSYTKSFDLLFTVPETAVYTVRFDYVMDVAEDRYKGKLLKYPEQAWQGTASSKPQKFRLTKQRL